MFLYNLHYQSLTYAIKNTNTKVNFASIVKLPMQEHTSISTIVHHFVSEIFTTDTSIKYIELVVFYYAAVSTHDTQLITDTTFQYIRTAAKQLVSIVFASIVYTVY